MSSHALRLAASCALLVVLMIPAPSLALGAISGKNVLFILDSSGSMAQKMGPETKMDTAKRVFNSLIDELPSDVDAGLEVYGHYGDKDCSVIDILAPVKKLDAGFIKAKVNALKPVHGATPIAVSLEKGAAVLSKLEGSKTIVLISDGEETCGGDPVAMAKKIRDQMGVDLVVHVVGFGVNDKQKQQLAAVAEAGGGKYYGAANAEQLTKSFKEIKQVVVQAPAPKPVQVAQAPAGDVFRDDFDGGDLAAPWKLNGPNENGHIVDGGKLALISTPGHAIEKNAEDVLVYTGPLPKNYEVETKMSRVISEYPGSSNVNTWSGLVFTQDKENMLSLFVRGQCCGDRRRAFFSKLQKGKWVPDRVIDIGGKSADSHDYELKVVKKSFKYTAFIRVDGEKWLKVGDHPFLGKGFMPGLDTYRHASAPETISEFDYFVIRAGQ